MLTGDNGILTQARNAKEKTEKASELERIQLAVIGSETKDNEYLDILDEENFQKELKKIFNNEELYVHPNGDGSFIITINDRKYYVNDDKTVIDSDNVIEIGPDDFEKFRDDVNNGNSYEGKAVLLTSDITLSGEWEPIGFIDSNTDEKNPETENNKPFKGIFDGCSHTINGITISNDKSYQGLFSFVVDGTIRNVTIGKNNNISGNTRVGGIVGYLYGFKGNISNCVNYSNINSNNSGGGIIGLIAGQHTILNCKNHGNIIGSGGIVGSSNGTDWEQFKNVFNTIINCGNYGSVTRSGDYCGGIIGFLKGDILNCCNKAKIQGSHDCVGGIVGSMTGGYTIENCYNISNVSCQNMFAGGILGTGDRKRAVTIKNCYSIGDVIGRNYVGDIMGNPDFYEIKNNIINNYTKDKTFTAKDLGKAFKDDSKNINKGYPVLLWE